MELSIVPLILFATFSYGPCWSHPTHLLLPYSVPHCVIDLIERRKVLLGVQLGHHKPVELADVARRHRLLEKRLSVFTAKAAQGYS